MNNFDVFIPRKRSQNLLIVEGNHEKNELFALLFKCFPEMNIDIVMVGKTLDYEAKRIRDNNMMGKL